MYRQVTSSGRATSAALSRNGLFLAFVEDGRLVVRSLAAGSSTVPVVSQAEVSRWGVLQKLEWSADGARLFAHADGGAYALPALGGTAQRVSERWGVTSMSPGGDRVAQWWQPWKLVRLRNAASGAIDTVTVAGDYTFLISAAWSPESNALVVQTTDGQQRYTMRLVDLRRRASRVLLEDSVPMQSITWSAAARAIYYVRQVYPRSGQVWKLPVTAAGAPSGPPTMVISLLYGLEFSAADDGTLAFARVVEVSNIWIGSAAGDTARRWLTTGTTSSIYPRFSPDGRRVAFIRDDGASANLFVTGSDSGAPEQLTFLNDRLVRHFAWSPDGQRIAFCHTGDAPPSIGIVPAAGGPVAPLTTSVVSADTCIVGWLSGEEVLYHRPGNRNFGVVSLRGRPHRDLVANDSLGWMFSVETDPSGRFVAAFWNRLDGAGTWLVSLADSSQGLLYRGFVEPVRWLRTGDALYALEGHNPPFRLLRIPIAAPDMATTVALQYPCPDGVVDVSPDGSHIVCAEKASTSDIWLIRDFDPTRPRARH